jgi:cellulase/cellobiase CelA1
VTVRYSVVHRWHDGFVGQLDIVNRGDSAVNGWQLVLTMPRNHMQDVWNADWQPDGWDSVIITPVRGDRVIEPGTSVPVDFVAWGEPSGPANCTFNGSPCD